MGGDRGEAIHSIFGTKGEQLAKKISTELKAIGQSTVKVYDREYNGTDYYGMIRGTTIPTVIVEVAFLDNANDVTICDTLEERKRNGIAIAHGILKQLGVAIKPLNNPKPPTNTSNSKQTYYRAVCGSFKDKANAEARVKELTDKGYSGCFVVAYEK